MTPGPIWNSWGEKDKIIPAENEKLAHSKYIVIIKSLTLKGYDKDVKIMKYEAKILSVVHIYFNYAVRK